MVKIILYNIVCLNNYINGSGASIYTGTGALNTKITNSIFNNNVATGNGGAIFASYQGSLNLSDCTFNHNSAYNQGGAVYMGADHSVSNCRFYNNNATYGGALVSVLNRVATNLTFINNSAIYGGAACFPRGYYRLTDCSFINNNAYDSSLVYCEDLPYVYIVGNCYFEGNEATVNPLSNIDLNHFNPVDYGFSYDEAYGDLAAKFINLQENSVIDLQKDYVAKTRININVNNVTINGNGHIIDGNGIYQLFRITDVDNVIFNNVTIKNSERAVHILRSSGSLYNKRMHTYFNNVTFINNTVDDGDGGAVFSQWNRQTHFTDCIFINNSASGNGGALYLADYDTLNNCKFYNNSAANGGAVYRILTAQASGLIFENNCADYGSAFYTLRTLDISDSNFKNNIATYQSTVYIEGNNKLNCNNVTFDSNYASLDIISNVEITGDYNDINNNIDELSQNFQNIADGSVVTLNNIIYTPITSVVINNNNVVVNGNGCTIDANGLKNLFLINGLNVTITNVTIKNAKRAIYFNQNGTVTKSIFINNTIDDDGGAIYFNEYGIVSDSQFIDNFAIGYDEPTTDCNGITIYKGGAIYFNIAGEISDSLINKSFL